MSSKVVILLACFFAGAFAALQQPEHETFAEVSDDILDDPKRNLDYYQLVQRLKEGKSILIDVREPEEISRDGKIPGTSIFIPIAQVHNALGAMSPEEFKKKYKANKPAKNANLIFSCHSGARSRKALAAAYSLGYTNSVHYKGGWLDWAAHNKLN